jgi:ubiquinone/menaquinone biosynthesis C-methylase UbiE
MGKEINLMVNYPKTKRDLSKRLQEKTNQDRAIARKFGKEFFDGERRYGYGGFCYNPKYWENVVPTFKEYYNLNSNSTILDIGCAKGFMLYDFKRLIPGISVAGIDISEYAIQNAKEEIKEFVQVADARELPFEDNSFDLVISITTLHNLNKEDLKIALKEVMRVTKKDAFITLDAYRSEEEKKRMQAWNLTALTVMHTDEWKKFFKEARYDGDYYWFIP